MSHHRRSLCRITALIGTGAAFMLGASAGRAWAAVPGLEHVSLSSASNSTYVKSVTVACPAGKRVLGVGGEINGGKSGPITMRELTPNSDLTSVTASAAEYAGGTPNAWDVKVFAVCAHPLPGLSRIAASSAFHAGGYRWATAKCPAGKQILGVGAKVLLGPTSGPPPGDVAITRMNYYNVTDVDVMAFGTVVDPYPVPWSVTAYAICASPLAGHEIKEAWSGGSFGPKMATTTCSPGKVLLGTGAWISFAYSDVLFEDGEVVFNRILPATNGVLSSAVPEPNGVNLGWYLSAEAICATP